MQICLYRFADVLEIDVLTADQIIQLARIEDPLRMERILSLKTPGGGHDIEFDAALESINHAYPGLRRTQMPSRFENHDCLLNFPLEPDGKLGRMMRSALMNAAERFDVTEQVRTYLTARRKHPSGVEGVILTPANEHGNEPILHVRPLAAKSLQRTA